MPTTATDPQALLIRADRLSWKALKLEMRRDFAAAFRVGMMAAEAWRAAGNTDAADKWHAYATMIASRPATPSPAPVLFRIVPLTLKQAAAFIKEHHRHHKPPRGMKFAIGVLDAAGKLVGVATAGRSVARAYSAKELSELHTLEVNRTCTDGTPHVNSMLYGACRRAAAAMGYGRLITYTEEGESGATMRAVGFRREAELEPRPSWAQSSLKLRHLRDPVGSGDRARVRWVWP